MPKPAAVASAIERGDVGCTGLSLFDSFFMAGFECSTHRRRDGRRLDLIAATGHDRFVGPGLSARMPGTACATVRDGLRWHLIETAPGPLRLVELPADAAGRRGRPASR